MAPGTGRPRARGHHRPPQPGKRPVPGAQAEELAHQPGQDIVAALQSLVRQVSQLQADNDRLRDDNDQLRVEVERIRALVRQIGGAIARQASELLAGTGD